MQNFFAIIVVLVGVAAGLVFLSQRDVFRQSSTQVTPTPVLQGPEVTGSTQIVIDEDLKASGSSYLDPKGVFGFLYPNEYQLDTQNDGQHIRIFKLGPTQKGQTEIYDGVLMVFEVVDLKGQSLEGWTNSVMQTQTSDGTTEVIAEKQPITVNNQPGYKYRFRGLGEFDNVVIQKDSNSPYAVSVTTLVADPGEIGFQAEVDKVLSTINMLK